MLYVLCFLLHKSNKKPEQSKALQQFVAPDLHSSMAQLQWAWAEGKKEAWDWILFCLCQAKLSLLFLSIMLAASVLLNKAGNCFSLQLIHEVAGAPPPHGDAGHLRHAPEGHLWDSLRLGSCLANGRDLTHWGLSIWVALWGDERRWKMHVWLNWIPKWRILWYKI